MPCRVSFRKFRARLVSQKIDLKMMIYTAVQKNRNVDREAGKTSLAWGEVVGVGDGLPDPP